MVELLANHVTVELNRIDFYCHSDMHNAIKQKRQKKHWNCNNKYISNTHYRLLSYTTHTLHTHTRVINTIKKTNSNSLCHLNCTIPLLCLCVVLGIIFCGICGVLVHRLQLQTPNSTLAGRRNDRPLGWAAMSIPFFCDVPCDHSHIAKTHKAAGLRVEEKKKTTTQNQKQQPQIQSLGSTFK